jgi:hypothetical protein
MHGLACSNQPASNHANAACMQREEHLHCSAFLAARQVLRHANLARNRRDLAPVSWLRCKHNAHGYREIKRGCLLAYANAQ